MAIQPPLVPTLEKLAAADAERSAVTDFLEWLESQKIHLAEYVRPEGYQQQRLVPIFQYTDDIILRWLNIDPKEVEKERRALLRYANDLNEVNRSPA